MFQISHLYWSFLRDMAVKGLKNVFVVAVGFWFSFFYSCCRFVVCLFVCLFCFCIVWFFKLRIHTMFNPPLPSHLHHTWNICTKKRQQQKLVTLRPTIWLSWLILSAVMRSKWWRNRWRFGFGCVGALNLRIQWRTGRIVNVFILRQHTTRVGQCSNYARVFYCHA